MRDTDILDTLRTARATLRTRMTESAKTRSDMLKAKVAADKAYRVAKDAQRAYDAALAATIEAFPESDKL